MRMETVLHETCQQYVARRLSEGWRIAGRHKRLVFLSPPDGSFIRPVDLRNDVEILRPNAAGDYENIPSSTSPAGSHWQAVDDVVPDEAATRVYTSSAYWNKDAYNLQNTSIPVGATINSVRVYFRLDGGGYPGYGQPFLRLGTNETAGAEQRHQYAWQTYSQILARPGGGSWSRADLNSLQGVIGLRAYSAPKPFHCTQVYVEVDFSPPTAYKDVASRFRLRAEAYRDTATRFLLNALNYQDVATRFELFIRGYSDIATRFKLKPLVYQDVSTRFYLYQPTWKSLQILEDIAELEAQVAGLKLKPKAHFEI